jgi:pimeloyl-ACP methyl ester carboxylesterase
VTRACLVTLALLACAARTPAIGAAPQTVARSVTLAQLFPASEAQALSKTLPADRPLQYRVREPAEGSRGVLVYVSPTDSGEPPADWASVLDRKRLLYIGAEGFGNSRPTAERVLVALAAQRLARQMGVKDDRRQFIAGMSGGGRVASQVITHFPQVYAGALCIAGADYFMPQDEAQRALVASRRLVLLTGGRDFNQREMRMVSRRYQQGGFSSRLQLIDLPHFAHQLPDAGLLTQALDFLDAN